MNPGPGNRQDNRQRGNAAQLLEKYKGLARDAQMQGDRVQTEYYLQYADHYFRVLNENRARFEEQRRQRGDDYGDEDEGEDDAGREAASERDEADGDDGREPPRERPQRYGREDRQDREPREARAPRADREDRGDREDRNGEPRAAAPARRTRTR